MIMACTETLVTNPGRWRDPKHSSHPFEPQNWSRRTSGERTAQTEEQVRPPTNLGLVDVLGADFRIEHSKNYLQYIFIYLFNIKMLYQQCDCNFIEGFILLAIHGAY